MIVEILSLLPVPQIAPFNWASGLLITIHLFAAPLGVR